jgi:anti-anti-sigma factor
VSVAAAGDPVRVLVAGELDDAAALELAGVLEDLACATDRRVEVDLSGVAFADLTAIGALLYAAVRSPAASRVRVVASSRAVRRTARVALDLMRGP